MIEKIYRRIPLFVLFLTLITNIYTFPVTQDWSFDFTGLKETISSPCIGDITGDGRADVVIGSGNGNVYAFSGQGMILSGWPYVTSAPVNSSPALGQLDTDSPLEIAIGSDDKFVYCFNGNGTLMSGWPQETGGKVISTPAIIDLDGDEKNDILVGSTDGYLYAWSSSGMPLSGFPYKLGLGATPPSIESSPACEDIDGDGNIEIAIGADDGRLYFLRYNGRSVSSIWSKSTNYYIRSSPSIGDIDGDGSLEIVVGSDDYSIYAYEYTGSPVRGWPIMTGYKFRYSSPALGDIDGDSVVEVIVASGDGNIYAFNGDGTAVTGFPVEIGGRILYSSPAVSDVNGDGTIDIIVGNDGMNIYAVSGRAEILSGWPVMVSGEIKSSPAIGNIDSDSALEIVITASDGYLYCYDSGGSSVSRSLMPWKMFKQDYWRTSVFGFAGGTVELPQATVSDIKEEVMGEITINYVLQDKQGDMLSIKPQFSMDSGLTWKDATILGRTSGISPSEYKGSLIWDSTQDIKGPLEEKGESDPAVLAGERREFREQKDVKFKIIPSDSGGIGKSGETQLFHIDNNKPPHISLQPIEGEQTRGVNIDYKISDEEFDIVKIIPEYSIDGGNTWEEANVSGITTDIRSERYDSDLTWESDLDTEGVDSENTIFRIIPSDLDPGTPAETNKFHLDNNEPPACQVADIIEEVSGDIEIQYELSDVESDALSFNAEYSLDNGETWNPATITGSNTNIESVEYENSLIWNSLADTRGVDTRTAQFKITPSDLDEGNADSTSNFHLDNNNTPTVEIAEIIGEQTGEFPIPYQLSDDEGDTLNIVCEYSEDGGNTWKNATISGKVSLINESLYSGEIYWDSLIDLLGVDSKAILFRITPSDLDEGEPGISKEIYVDNNNPPSVLLSTLTGELSEDIDIYYTISDLERDYITMECEYSDDGGATWKPADVSGTLEFGESEYNGKVVWHSDTDIKNRHISNAQFRIIPYDNDEGTIGKTTYLEVDNDEPPSVAIGSVPGEQTGEVSIPYTISDVENDPVSLFVEYSLDEGFSYNPATILTPTEDLSSTEYKGTLTWDTNSDIKGIDSEDIKIRITPSDRDPGQPAESMDIWVDDNNPPTVTLSTPEDEQFSEIIFDYSIEDDENDLINLEPKFSEDGGANWYPATVEGFIDQIDSSGYLGSLTWLSDQDLPGTDQTDIQFALFPSDRDPGTMGSTNNFHLDNNELPSITLEEITTEQSGNVEISYTLEDAEYDANAIVVEYSADGGFSWELATIGTTTEIDPTRYSGTVLWTSEDDLPDIDRNDIMVRITPLDNDEGFSDVTNPFRLDNNEIPTAEIEPITEEVSGDVTIDFSLSDENADSLSIEAEYSIDGGATWKPATLSGDTVSLQTPHYEGTIIWNSSLDESGVDSENTQFRIIPRDNDPGEPGISNTFHMDNNLEPSIYVEDITEEVSGDIEIFYSIEDDEEDTISISSFYSTDQGATWSPATVSGITEGLTPQDYMGSITWHSDEDIHGVYSEDIRFKIVPSDADESDVISTGSIFVDNNTTPEIALTTPEGEVSGDVTIPFNISDEEGNDVDLRVEFSTDGGEIWQEATVTSTTHSISSASYKGNLVWNSLKDLEGVESSDLLVRVTPSDEDQGEPTTTAPIHLDNNTPPSIEIQPITEEVSGDVLVDFTIDDLENDDVSLEVEYSPDNGNTWKPATITGETSNISSFSYAGGFTWNSSVDLPSVDNERIAIKITPSDNDVGEEATISDIHLDNNEPPTVTLRISEGTYEGDIEVGYTISDSEGDPIDLDVKYSPDGGISWDDATISGTLTSLDRNRYSGSFIWKSNADISGVDTESILIKVIPSDIDEGQPSQSDFLHLDNNTPPTISLGSPTIPEIGGDITIPYDLYDEEGDSLSLLAEFSFDGGVSWNQATIMGLTTNLQPEDYTGELVWASSVDLPGQYLEGVDFKITPYDNEKGESAHISLGTVDNNIPPSVVIHEPFKEVSGDVTIGYSIYDPEEDTVNLDVEYSTDEGTTFKKASIISGDTSITSTGYLGELVWDTSQDLGTFEGEVVLKAIPSDTKSGDIEKSAPFRVDNNRAPNVVEATYTKLDEDNIRVDFSLSDTENDTLSISVEFSEDNGITWNPASVSGDIDNLYPDNNYSFTWNITENIPTIVEGTDIKLKITPTDEDTGNPKELTIQP